MCRINKQGTTFDCRCMYIIYLKKIRELYSNCITFFAIELIPNKFLKNAFVLSVTIQQMNRDFFFFHEIKIDNSILCSN